MTSYPAPLPAAEQAALCAQAQAGDRPARDRLVATSMRLVVARALYFAKRTEGADPNDFVSDGAMGLLRAIEKYDAAKGANFATYARNWIDDFIRKAGVLFVREVKAGDASRTVLLRDYRSAVASGANHDEALDSVAKKHGTRPETAAEVVRALTRSRAKSLDAPLGEGAEQNLLDILGDGREGAEERLGQAQAQAALEERIAGVRAGLNDRERAILDTRLLADGDEATLQDLADVFGLSRERVRQIEVVLTRKLRAALGSKQMRQVHYMRERRARHARAGLCSVCVGRALPTKRMCATHLRIYRRYGEHHRRTHGARPRQFVLLTHHGETLHVSEWAKVLDLKASTLFKRWEAGWSVERTLTEPVTPGRRVKELCVRGHPRAGNRRATGECAACSVAKYAEKKAARPAGTCSDCPAPADPERTRCTPCRTKHNVAVREARHARDRKDTLKAAPR